MVFFHECCLKFCKLDAALSALFKIYTRTSNNRMLACKYWPNFSRSNLDAARVACSLVTVWSKILLNLSLGGSSVVASWSSALVRRCTKKNSNIEKAAGACMASALLFAIVGHKHAPPCYQQLAGVQHTFFSTRLAGASRSPCLSPPQCVRC